MNFQNKICVSYPGGAYGSYLLWLLYTLTSDDPVLPPFDYNGTSHKVYEQAKNKLMPIDTDDLSSIKVPDSVYLIKNHPKSQFHHDMNSTLQQIIDRFGKAILLYPSKHHYLLIANNYMYKPWRDGTIWEGPLGYIDTDDIYINYPEAQGIELENLPQWLVREFISLNFFDFIESAMGGWYFPSSALDDNILVITTHELLFELHSTLERIRNEYNLTWTKSITNIEHVHSEKIKQQKFLTQDQMCAKILNSFEKREHFAWQSHDITLVSEAYIQKTITQMGYEVACVGLNNFPTDTTALRDIACK